MESLTEEQGTLESEGPRSTLGADAREHERTEVWDGETWFRSVLHFWVQPARRADKFPARTFARTHKDAFAFALPKPAFYSMCVECLNAARRRGFSCKNHSAQHKTFSCDIASNSLTNSRSEITAEIWKVEGIKNGNVELIISINSNNLSEYCVSGLRSNYSTVSTNSNVDDNVTEINGREVWFQTKAVSNGKESQADGAYENATEQSVENFNRNSKTGLYRKQSDSNTPCGDKKKSQVDRAHENGMEETKRASRSKNSCSRRTFTGVQASDTPTLRAVKDCSSAKSIDPHEPPRNMKTHEHLCSLQTETFSRDPRFEEVNENLNSEGTALRPNSIDHGCFARPTHSTSLNGGFRSGTQSTSVVHALSKARNSKRDQNSDYTFGNATSSPTRKADDSAVGTKTQFEAVRRRRNFSRLRRQGYANRSGSEDKSADWSCDDERVTDFPLADRTFKPVLCVEADVSHRGESFEARNRLSVEKAGASIEQPSSVTSASGITPQSRPSKVQNNQYSSGRCVCTVTSPIDTVIISCKSANANACGLGSLALKEVEKEVDIQALSQQIITNSKRKNFSQTSDSVWPEPECVQSFRSDSDWFDSKLPNHSSKPESDCDCCPRSHLAISMVPIEVSETVAIIKVPTYSERSYESRVEYSDMRRHKQEVKFEPALAPVRFADTMIVYGKNNTRKRYVSRTFYEPRVKPKRFADTNYVFPKDKQQRFASFLDYHIDECRKWFKTCLELKAKTFTTVHTPQTSGTSVTTSCETKGLRREVIVSTGPGASQVFIPPRQPGDGKLAERQFRMALDGKDRMDINMNGPLLNGF